MNIFIGKNSGVNHHFTAVNQPLGKGEIEKKNVFQFPASDADRKDTNAKDKKTLLQRRALHVVINQLQNDGQIDKEFEGQLDRQNELVKVTGEAQKQVNRLDQLHNELRDSYGVKADSQEEQELLLIRKSKDRTQQLSTDEWNQLASMIELTDYQKEALSLDKIRETWGRIISDGNREICDSAATVEAMSIELLKSHPMIDAQKTAQDLMDAAVKEQISELMDQAKEHVDEQVDEAKEAKEEAAKEEVAKEEAAKEESSSLQENGSQVMNSTEDIKQNQLTQTVTQDKVEAFIQKLGILEEDVKGLQVNEQI